MAEAIKIFTRNVVLIFITSAVNSKKCVAGVLIFNTECVRQVSHCNFQCILGPMTYDFEIAGNVRNAFWNRCR